MPESERDATGLSRGVSRLLIVKQEITPPGCHGLAPWSIPAYLRQADNEMKLWCGESGVLRYEDLQVEKAVEALARLCPSWSLVSGMASITLVNWSFHEWLISP